MTVVWSLAVGLALLALNAFFVAAEFALLASRTARLEQVELGGDRRGGLALGAVRHLSLMLAGAQLGITIASLGLGAVLEPAIDHLLVGPLNGIGLSERMSHAVSFTLALAVVVLLHMVVGEMAPKSWAITDPERSILLLVRPFRAFVWLFRPVIVVLNASANGLVRLFGVQPQDERAMAHSPGDLKLLLEKSVEEGTLERSEADLLSRAITLSGLHAHDAMTPRDEVVAVPSAATVAELEVVMRSSGRSRVVVYGEALDDVVGVAHVRDVLVLDDAARTIATAGSLSRPVLMDSELRPLEDLLLDMRAQRRRVAVIVDELGSVAGIVTMQGLLEALVGRP
ncbi:MAG TPA: hemolysin family protein [Acidimicrobiales bacterium]